MASISLSFPSVALDGVGLMALADLIAIQERCALTGGASFFDAFILCPGIHKQQKAVELNRGEYPACAALTSGYVFRVENPAMVYYLQKIGRTGQLTTLSVVSRRKYSKDQLKGLHVSINYSLLPQVAYFTAVALTLAAIALLSYTRDYWGLATILLLMFARVCNVLVIKRRSRLGWCGQPEPGVKGDLLILLSQDRWIRLQGLVDDLKAITSGLWMQDQSFLEACWTDIATLLVYLNAALAANAAQIGKVTLVVLLILNAILLSIANTMTEKLEMHGRVIVPKLNRKTYARRLDLAKELIEETKSDDWAVRLGMINAKDSKSNAPTDGGVIM